MPDKPVETVFDGLLGLGCPPRGAPSLARVKPDRPENGATTVDARSGSRTIELADALPTLSVPGKVDGPARVRASTRVSEAR